MSLSGIEEFILFGFVPLMIGIFATPTRLERKGATLAGRIVIPPSDPLPENAIVTIELAEQRRGQTMLPVIARETMRWRGGGAQKFAIGFDATAIDPMAFYALSARIVAGTTVLFETRHAQLAAPLSAGALTLMLMPPVGEV